jgi:hypothetical protein
MDQTADDALERSLATQPSIEVPGVVFVIDDDASMRAQRTLASADDAVASSHVRLATDQVAIFLAFGGRWE